MPSARLSTARASDLGQTLRHLLPLVRGEKKLVALGMVAVLVEVLARLAEPWPLKLVIDEVLPAAGRAPAVPDGFAGLPALALLAAVGLRAAGAYVSTMCFALIGSRVTTVLRERAYSTLLVQSVRYHQSNQAGDLLSRLTSDVTRLQDVAVTVGLPLVANVATFFGMAIVMLVLDPLLALVVLAVFPLFLLGGTGAPHRPTDRRRHRGGAADRHPPGAVRRADPRRARDLHQLPQERLHADAQPREVLRADQPRRRVRGAGCRGVRHRARPAGRLRGTAPAPGAR
ncbi:MAG: ABC transporter transmembrane domain-containing protein [Actinomycetota bacterium]|nr:ABC transporter transmembrane domain-containing protein [Actinomycetota bacterium]